MLVGISKNQSSGKPPRLRPTPPSSVLSSATRIVGVLRSCSQCTCQRLLSNRLKRRGRLVAEERTREWTYSMIGDQHGLSMHKRRESRAVDISCSLLSLFIAPTMVLGVPICQRSDVVVLHMLAASSVSSSPSNTSSSR